MSKTRLSAAAVILVGCSSPLVASYPEPRNPTSVEMAVSSDKVRACVENAKFVMLSPDLDMLRLSTPQAAPPPYTNSSSAWRLAHAWGLPVGLSDAYSRGKQALQYTAAFSLDLREVHGATLVSVKDIDYRVVTGESAAPLSEAGSKSDWERVPATSLDEYCILTAIAKCVGVRLPGFRTPHGVKPDAWQSKAACTLTSSTGDAVSPRPPG